MIGDAKVPNAPIILLTDLEDRLEKVSKSFDELKDDLNKTTEKLDAVKKSSTEKTDELEKRILSSEGRSFEIVGLLSSVVALILVSASTANAQRDPFSAYLIIVSVAAALMLFACLLHAFFRPQLKLHFREYWFPFALVPAIVIVVAGVLACTVVQR